MRKKISEAERRRIAKKHIQMLHGMGFFDSLKSVAKRAANVVTNTYSPNAEAAVKKYGDFTVSAFEIIRKPVESVFKGLLNAISLGKFNEYKAKYDDVFHLALILKLNRGNEEVYLLTEKRPNIHFTPVKSFTDHKAALEDVILDNDFKHITFAELIARTMAIMGDKFHKYDPVNNNCQIYIVALVNQLGVFKYNDFILQNVRDFVSGHTSGIATFITKLGHFTGRLTGNAHAGNGPSPGLAGVKHKKHHKSRSYFGGAEPTPPSINSQGIKEIAISDFAPWQQFLASLPADKVQQDLSTLGTAGKVGDLALTAAELIPEVGEFIAIGHQVANALIGIFYKPKESIQQKLKKQGIDIFMDDTMIVNPEYPDTDPRHYQLLLPGGNLVADIKDQARYSALIFYQTVLGVDMTKWIHLISPAEVKYLFPPEDASWPTKFGLLAQTHGHSNPYLLKKSASE
jgi:hypothetical protein